MASPITIHIKPQDFHLAVRDLRLHLGLSQSELSRRTGIARPNLSRVESGKHSPNMETIGRISQGLKVNLVIHTHVDADVQDWNSAESLPKKQGLDTLSDNTLSSN